MEAYHYYYYFILQNPFTLHKNIYSNIQARQTRELTSKSTLTIRGNILQLREKKHLPFPLKLQDMSLKSNL